ncbi:MAG: molybdenum cofactor guanylyltransferase [Armatimonadota bacterium]
MQIDAVLPAGGRIVGKLAYATGTEVKALFPFAGQTLLAHTLAALRQTNRVRRLVVVGPPEVAPHARGLADVVLREAGSGARNIMRGMEWSHAADDQERGERVLVLTTDLPFLTPGAISGFLDLCPPELDLCVPLLNRQEFEARFPGSYSRYVRLRDGEWMIGCAMLMNPAAIMANRATIERVFAARRSQLGMARLLGLSFIARFLTRRLTVAQIETKCLQLLGCSGGAIRGCAPELGFDIDYPQDYEYALAQQPSALAGRPPRS